MKQIKQSHREKTLAVITAVVITGTLVFTTVAEPQLERCRRGQERLSALQLDLTQIQADMRIKDRIDQIYLEIQPLIKSDGTDQQEISLFTRELNELYSQLPVRIKSVKLLPTADQSFYRKLSINIEMTGTAKDIIQFINSVEASAKPIRIERLGMNAKEAVDTLQASFLITKVISNANQKPQEKMSKENTVRADQ
jgi:Tfp pilus assembly protein PilO